MSYLRQVYRVPEALADDLAACLVAAGALGCVALDAATWPFEWPSLEGASPSPELESSGEARLEAWFEEDATPLDISHWHGVEVIASQTIAEQDWLANYRASSRPFTVARFRIDPRDVHAEIDGALEPESGGRIHLQVPAENAFGTGSHESTRLMLLWLDDLANELSGRRVLDVGSGSGILAFAALRLGAAHVVGFDLDPPSVVTARLNGLRNGLESQFFAGTAAALAGRAGFDWLLINVLPERILGDLPRLLSTLVPGGRVISSGNLVARRDELLQVFEKHGLRLQDEKIDGEWISFLFER